MPLLRKNRYSYTLIDSKKRITLRRATNTNASDALNNSWKATDVVRTRGGYKVLVTGTGKLKGRYQLWKVNSKGEIIRSTRWRGKRQRLNQWENIFSKDLDQNGIISKKSSYQLEGKNNLVTIKRNQWKPSNAASDRWNATDAIHTPRGYKVLLTGKKDLEGSFKIWHINRKGEITRSTRWKKSETLKRWEKTFTKDFDNNGIVSRKSRYLLRGENGWITIRRNRWKPSDSSSLNWDATHAVRTPGGYKVLLTGTNKLNGKYKIWNINKKGQIVRSSRWRSRDWAIRAGWEQIFGDVIDRDGAIGQADDYSNDVHTTGVIKIGRTNSGELETKTDRDWFAVQLKGGYRYEFELVGESLRDPFLNLRSDEGNVLAYNDDNQNDLNSRIVFTAFSDGKYFLDAGAYSELYTGTYKISAITSSPPESSFNSSDGYGHADAKSAFELLLGISIQDRSNFGGSLWGLDNINAAEVWAGNNSFEGATGDNVTIAVIDTGVDSQHKEFRGRLVQGYDFVDNDFNANDGNGHGTHVAGTIAAANDGRGITGVAYDADIMPIRVLDDSGSGSLADVVAGIHWATDMGADVINLSLGGGGYSQAMFDAVKYASQRGTVVVMAAGNSGGSSPDYPAAHARHYGIAVGAANQYKNIAQFSNRAGNQRLDYVTAPGVDIYSTITGGGYARYSGTSMATPHVAGIAALLKSYDSNLSAERIEDLLTQSAKNSTKQSKRYEQNERLDVITGESQTANRNIINLETIQNFSRKQLSKPLIGHLSGGNKKRARTAAKLTNRIENAKGEYKHIDNFQIIDAKRSIFTSIDFYDKRAFNPRDTLINLLKSNQYKYFEVDQEFKAI